jgi:hypothetical protein
LLGCHQIDAVEALLGNVVLEAVRSILPHKDSPRMGRRLSAHRSSVVERVASSGPFCLSEKCPADIFRSNAKNYAQQNNAGSLTRQRRGK